MKKFDYNETKFTNKSLELCDEIKKCQGKMEIFEKNYPQILSSLQNKTYLNESYFSHKIEGIILDYKKCEKIISNIKANTPNGKAGDVSNFELQFTGYTKILMTINKRLDFFKIDTTSILAMFYALFNIPATYKKSVYRKNDYQEMINGKEIVRVRVSPVNAYETPLYIGSATKTLTESFKNNPAACLINIAKYIVDFMCIMPFDVGCGRIARILMHLLLQKTDINISKYISVSQIFEKNAAKYYEKISLCCEGWENSTNTYDYFIEYFLRTIIDAYNELFGKTNFVNTASLSKTERIYDFIKQRNDEISKRQIIEANPDISVSTIENALHKLKSENKIKQVSGGRSAKYRIN